MGRILIGIAFGLFIGLQSHPASAFGETGNVLLNQCGTGPFQDMAATFNNGVCGGYIEASEDIFENAGVVCPPAHVSNEQLVDIVIKHLLNHPETREIGASYIVLAALKDAFPCAPKPKS
jgi:hypothetical protein